MYSAYLPNTLLKQCLVDSHALLGNIGSEPQQDQATAIPAGFPRRSSSESPIPSRDLTFLIGLAGFLHIAKQANETTRVHE